MNKQTIKFMTRNPLTNHLEEVMPEDEFELSDVTPFFLTDDQFVTVPGYEAAWAYDEWIAQMKGR